MHCLRMSILSRIDMSAMAHHHCKMDFCVNTWYAFTQNTMLKSSKQRMAINNLSVETSSHL